VFVIFKSLKLKKERLFLNGFSPFSLSLCILLIDDFCLYYVHTPLYTIISLGRSTTSILFLFIKADYVYIYLTSSFLSFFQFHFLLIFPEKLIPLQLYIKYFDFIIIFPSFLKIGKEGKKAQSNDAKNKKVYKKQTKAILMKYKMKAANFKQL